MKAQNWLTVPLFTTIHRKVIFSFIRIIVLNIIKDNVKFPGVWAGRNSRGGFWRRAVKLAPLPLRITLLLVVTIGFFIGC